MGVWSKIVDELKGDYDLDGTPKPFLRGKIHLFLTILAPIWGKVMLDAGAHHPWIYIHCWIAVVCFFINFAASALLHNPRWGKVGMLHTQHIDHCGIYLMICGSAAPLTAFFSPGWWLTCHIIQWTFALVGSILVMVGAMDDPDPEAVARGTFDIDAPVICTCKMGTKDPNCSCSAVHKMTAVVDKLEGALESSLRTCHIDASDFLKAPPELERALLEASASDKSGVSTPQSAVESPTLQNLQSLNSPRIRQRNVSSDSKEALVLEVAPEHSARQPSITEMNTCSDNANMCESPKATDLLRNSLEATTIPTEEAAPSQQKSRFGRLGSLPPTATPDEVVKQRRARRAFIYVVMGMCYLIIMPEFYFKLETIEMLYISGLALFYVVGALFYAFRVPDFCPFVFGYHEMFHCFCAIAMYCTLRANVMGAERWNPEDHLRSSAAHWFYSE